MRNQTVLWKPLTISLFLTLGISTATTAATLPSTKPQNSNSPQSIQLTQAEADIVTVASSSETFSTLVQAVKAADLVETLQGEGPFTVFAPTNQAFAQLPDGVVEFLLQPENKDLLVDVLSYHVVSGAVTSTQLETGMVDSLNGELSVDISDQGVMVNNANVIQADVEASNGVIHAVDQVLLSEDLTETIQSRMESTSASPEETQSAEAEESQDIVSIASNNDNFSTLVQAVQAADLVETLQGEGPFTVFAPTNQAFATLPDGVVEFLLQPENKDLLVDVLTYHVVSGAVTSEQIEPGTVDALGGGLAVAVSGDRVIVNNASVIQADIEASNGVIHAVNQVLLPEGLTDTIQSRMN
ncbi:MAG: fasciclin domain-containing protein [Halothece sp. Uz-M2-17]|nr:fasciclin domain-containing protein [Halothece sp. Uz-M2-17]